MAELVHLRLERSLPELEEMERVGLFNRQEIKKLVKKRQSFEYKLRRNRKRKEDYLQYIEFEMSLLLLIRKRRERFLCESKKKEIDTSIAKRINRLFKAVISRFPEDEKLWIDQIQYCKKMKWHDNINALCTRLLQVHSKTPKLWIMAAKWEMEDNHSPENARKLLQRGVLMNPKSEIIWREYFRMELMYSDLIRKRREVLQLHHMKDMETDENDVVLSGRVANVVYNKAVEEIGDVEFALSFLQICLDFDFASSHIDHILNDVRERYPNKEETLDALAKRPLLNIDEQIKKGKEMGIKKKVVLQRIYEEIYSKYDEAVKIVPTEKMWSYYTEFLLSLLKSAKENKKMKLQALVLSKMQLAAESDCLALDYYSQWIDLLFEKGNDEEALSIALSAARKWNKVSLWVKCITLHIQCQKSNKTIYLLFTEALAALDEKESVSVWKLGVDWLSISDPEKLIDFFEKGINKRKEVSFPLKEMYLEAVALRNGTQAARDLYKKFKKMGPLSLQIIRKMIAIEKGQLKPSMDLIRKCFEDGIKEFGSNNVDVWLDYMKLEVEYVCGNPKLYGMLHWKAMKTLEPEYVKEFQNRITEYSTGCGLSSNWELAS